MFVVQSNMESRYLINYAFYLRLYELSVYRPRGVLGMKLILQTNENSISQHNSIC